MLDYFTMPLSYLRLLPLGFAVGAYGTLIGAGGGFVLVPILLLLYPNESPEIITSISLAVVFLMLRQDPGLRSHETYWARIFTAFRIGRRAHNKKKILSRGAKPADALGHNLSCPDRGAWKAPERPAVTVS
jgi:hypothetical protein